MKKIITFIFIFGSFFAFNLFGYDAEDTQVWQDYVNEGPVSKNLPDFSYAGCDEAAIVEKGNYADVTDSKYGAIPDDNIDDRDAIQAAINDVGSKGGGVVFFPEGRYNIRGGKATDVIQIKYDNIILRGVGKDERGRQDSILFLERDSSEGKQNALGTIDNDMRQNACIQIMGDESTQELATLTENAYRGDTIIRVNDTSSLYEGRVIRIELVDPVNLDNPDPSQIDLIKKLTEPRQIQEHETYTYAKDYVKTIYWIARVKRVISSTRVELNHPLRVDHLLRYKPRIISFNKALTGIGIEDLGLESDWPGQFVHHKPYPYWRKDKDSVRETQEQDYRWGGIWVSWAVDCWIDNVDLRDFTQGIVITHASYFTVKNITLWGTEGHAGITLSMSFNNLFKNIDLVQRTVHPLSLRSWCCGNVFTECTAHYDKRDQVSGTSPVIDFHGMFPYENLFERLKGFYVSSGGLEAVHPHSGVRNVWWNVITPPQIDRHPGVDEEFLNANFVDHDVMYKEYPQSFVVGVRAPKGSDLLIKVGGKSTDHVSEWVTTELLNKEIDNNPSLYNAQVALRDEEPTPTPTTTPEGEK